MIDRRAMIVGGCAAAGAPLVPGVVSGLVSGAWAQAEHPAVARMRAVTADLIATQRTGTASAYYKMIDRHADVPAIALYALGAYRPELKRSQQATFFRGVGMFMARYFTDQAQDYTVAKAEISPSVRTDVDEVLVHSKVTLTSGASYTVVWRLANASQDYKIRDVQVLGFSLRYLQRSMFQSYIARRGTFQALYAALTQ
jgi:phospholipid transport system substrate-binding protein